MYGRRDGSGSVVHSRCVATNATLSPAGPLPGTIDCPRVYAGRRCSSCDEHRVRRECVRDDPRAARQSDRGGLPLSSFLTNHGVVVALVCAACAVVYGLRDHAIPARAVAGQREDAGHLAGCPAGRACVPEPPVHDDRGGGGRAVRCADLHPEHRGGVRVRDRRPAVRVDRVHRHERVGALERARGGGSARRAFHRR